MRDLLFTVTFVGCVDKMGTMLRDKQLNNVEFCIFFLGVFVFWSDSTQLRNRWGRDGPVWYLYFTAVLAGLVGVCLSLSPLNPRVLCACAGWIRLIDVVVHSSIAVSYAGRKHLFGRNLAVVHLLSLAGYVVGIALDSKHAVTWAMAANVLLHYCYVPSIALLQCLCIRPSPWMVPINMARYTQSFSLLLVLLLARIIQAFSSIDMDTCQDTDRYAVASLLVPLALVWLQLYQDVAKVAINDFAAQQGHTSRVFFLSWGFAQPILAASLAQFAEALSQLAVNPLSEISMFGDYRSSEVAITALGCTLLLITSLRVLQLHKTYPAPGPKLLLGAVGRVLYATVAVFVIGYLAERVLVLLGCMLGLLMSLKCWDMLLSTRSLCTCAACAARHAGLEHSGGGLAPNADEAGFGFFQHQFHSHLGALLYVPEDKLRELHAGIRSLVHDQVVSSGSSGHSELRLLTASDSQPTKLGSSSELLPTKPDPSWSSNQSSGRGSARTTKSTEQSTEQSAEQPEESERHAVELDQEEVQLVVVEGLEEEAARESELSHVESRESLWRRRQREMDEDEEDEDEDDEEDSEEDDEDESFSMSSPDPSERASDARATSQDLAWLVQPQGLKSNEVECAE